MRKRGRCRHMDWYYSQAGHTFGPFTEEEFAQLIAQGKVLAETLVWHEGMADWQEYRQVLSAQPQAAPAGLAEQEAGFCSQCGRVFPAEQMVRYGNVWICASCKPAFFQKIREGLEPGAPGLAGVRYGGFWIRLVALLVDGVALWMVKSLIDLTPWPVVVVALQWAVAVAYETYFLGRFGATPGKMACGLRVVVSDGSPVSYARAFARYWAKLLGWFTMLVGYIVAAFDDQKRALHDYICNTRVVYQ